MVFMRLMDYLEQFFFCCPLAKHTRKEMFRKLDSFNKKHQLLQTHCMSVCAHGASVMIRTKRVLLIYEKRKRKYLGS